MPILPIELISLVTNILVIVFVIIYLFSLKKKEKVLEKKLMQEYTDYHHILHDAYSQERQILSTAKDEAAHIIQDTHLETQEAQETIDRALTDMTNKIEQSSLDEGAQMLNSYSETLKQIITASITDFTNITRGLEGDMQKQVKEFKDTLLPNLEKELEAYKVTRLKQSEETISRIVKKVAEEVLNKSLSTEDHQKLVIEALEKAKAEGVFS